MGRLLGCRLMQGLTSWWLRIVHYRPESGCHGTSLKLFGLAHRNFLSKEG